MTSTPIADQLAALALGTGAAALPADCRRAVQRLVLDTTGCALGGLATESGRILVQLARSQGGTPEATLYGEGIRLPAASAAYALSHAANALDADECLQFRTHLACCIVPSSLALAEREGTTGLETLAAIAVGFEVAARICLALPFYAVSDSDEIAVTPIQGYSAGAFGVAAAAGRIFGLDGAQLRHAFGIAYAATPAQRAHWLACTAMTKYAHFGAIAQAGIQAALLARMGFTGDTEVLEPHREFWRGLGATGCDYDALTRDLGRRWLAGETSYKLYPAARPLSVIIDLFAGIVRQHDLSTGEIEEVVVRLPPSRQVREFAARSEPGNIEDAAMSAAYAMAMIAARIPPGPQWANPAHLRNDTLRNLMRRMRAEARPDWQQVLADQVRKTGTYLRVPTEVKVRARGHSWSAYAEQPRGDPGPLAASDDELREKFRTLAQGRLPAASIDRAIAAIDALPSAPDLRELMDALAGAPA